MRDIFIIWITIQLMFIGAALCNAENEIIRGVYDCAYSNRETSPAVGAFFPLVYFTGDRFREAAKSYCLDKSYAADR